LNDRWYSPHPIVVFKPLAGLFGWLAARRRKAFLTGQKPIRKLPVPVIVVGNIVVGGAGKTPAVLAVVHALKQLGYNPGILSRGYGAALKHPRKVHHHSRSSEVGDEPILLLNQAQVPVAVGVDRFAVGQLLLAHHPEIDCLVCDDGLQHYGLYRDLELLVIARDRGIGNGALLPAGPLREPVTRVEQVDAVVLHGHSAEPNDESNPTSGSVPSSWMNALPAHLPQFDLRLTMGAPLPFQEWRTPFDHHQEPDQPSPQSSPIAKQSGDRTAEQDIAQGWAVWQDDSVHAIAGIGHPQRFFKALEDHGMRVTGHAFPDHHRYVADELTFPEPYPIMMTEKDAVKCLNLNLDRHWVVPLHAELEPRALEWLRIQLEKLDGSQTT